MIDHTGIGVSDIVRSAIFYDAALRPLPARGAAPAIATDHNREDKRRHDISTYFKCPKYGTVGQHNNNRLKGTHNEIRNSRRCPGCSLGSGTRNGP